jgi:predicted N-formylglutamate amidohydrolase
VLGPIRIKLGLNLPREIRSTRTAQRMIAKLPPEVQERSHWQIAKRAMDYAHDSPAATDHATRDDLIADDNGQRAWSPLLARLLPQAYQELVAAEALRPA